MVDRAFLHRLRTSGGPSHDLLVLLDRLRVVTTVQAARASGAPERTVRWRLERLRSSGLVDCRRPGREVGSAPRHWWLRPPGARLVTGTAVADGGSPAGLFLAHAAAITEVWLALTEHGPALGIEVRRWETDRAGWREWQEPNSPWGEGHPQRVTPDAVAHLSVDGEEAVVFIEVDLATMTHTVLREKVARYLAYRDSTRWQDEFPYCPPMLLLTTTATRAAGFAKTAGRVLDAHRPGFDERDRAAVLVSAACGLVRDPGRAVAEHCWSTPDAAELTLTEILAERAAARRASQAWFYERDVVQVRQAHINSLSWDARRVKADEIGSEPAADYLHMVVDADPERFHDRDTDLAVQVATWLQQLRSRDRDFRPREAAQPFLAALEAHHDTMWRGMARRLLAAHEQAPDHPRLYEPAATLAAGRLPDPDQILALDQPPEQTRDQIQHALLGDYHTRRTADIDQHLAGLGRRQRRHADRAALEAGYDNEHLCVCDTCGLVYLDEQATSRCDHCSGTIRDWQNRASVTGLAPLLTAIRDRLVRR